MAFFKDHIITHKKNDKERKDKMQNQTQLFEMFEIAIYLHEQLYSISKIKEISNICLFACSTFTDSGRCLHFMQY